MNPVPTAPSSPLCTSPRTEWQFNGFLCGDNHNFVNGDTEGPLAVRNNAYFQNFGVNVQYSCSTAGTLGLAVSGAATSTTGYSSASINGDFFYGISATSTFGENCGNGQIRKDSNLDSLFGGYCNGTTCSDSYLGQYSAQLANQPSNVNVVTNFGSNLVITPTGPGTQFVKLSAAQLIGITSTTFDTSLLGPNDVIYITVTGTPVTLSGGGNFYSSNPSFNQRILWNFPDATLLNIRVSLQGSVIAPCATVTSTGGGNIEGNLFAFSWNTTGGLELHWIHPNCTIFAFLGPPAPANPSQPVPDPLPAVPVCANNYQQCGGIGFTGATICCNTAFTCTGNQYWKGCQP